MPGAQPMTAAADAMVRRGLKGAAKTDGKQPLHATCSLRDGAQYSCIEDARRLARAAADVNSVALACG